jgi:hypothetical protein
MLALPVPPTLCAIRFKTFDCWNRRRGEAAPPPSFRRGDEAQAVKREAGFRARRWVVERTHSWLNSFRFRRILTRWEQTPTSPCSTSPAVSSPGAPPTVAAYRNRL